MPKRTNDFQELVTLIVRSLAPRGAKVTPSAELLDGAGNLREVDALIEGEYGPYTIKIAVEARDNSTRNLDIQAFDSFVAKYRGECRVLVDKFVLVSRRGFTKGVIEKAKKLDVELLTIEEAKNTDWSKFGPGRFQFRVAPHICGIQFIPRLVVDDKQHWCEAQMICRHGHDHGTPFKIANCMVFHRLFPNNPGLVKEFERQARAGYQGGAFLNATIPLPDFAVRFKGQDHSVSAMIVRLHMVSDVGTVSHSAFRRTSTMSEPRIIHRIQSVAGGKEFSVTIPVSGPTPDKILLKIDDARPTPEAKKKQRKERTRKLKKKARRKK